jgi:hypothetical protein
VAVPSRENPRRRLGAVARIHHSYADGMALVQVLLSLTDTSPTPVKGSDLARRG